MRLPHSCESCARRKRKCNKAKPVCDRCAKLKVSCYWPSQEQFQGQWNGDSSLSTVFHIAASGTFISRASSLPHRNSLQKVEDVIYACMTRSCSLDSATQSSASAHGQLFNVKTHHVSGADSDFLVHNNERCKAVVSNLSSELNMWEFEKAIADACTGLWGDSPKSEEDNLNSSERDLTPRARLTCLDGQEAPEIDGEVLVIAPTSADCMDMIVPRRLMTKEDLYTGLFFSYFCSDFSIFGAKAFWKQTIPGLMSEDSGIRNAVLAAAAIYHHNSQNSPGAKNDALLYYGKGVQGVRQHLEVTDLQHEPKPVILIGLMLLMTFEMSNGNIRAYYSHLDALSHIVQQMGPSRCKIGIYSIILKSMALANINNSILREKDTFFASEEWCSTLSVAFGPAWSRVLGLYAKAARTVYIHHSLLRESCWPDTVTVSRNYILATQLAYELGNVLGHYHSQGLPSVASSTSHSEILAESPFQPSLTLPNMWQATNFPTLVANILKLESTFDLRSCSRSVLVRQLVQVSQNIIVHTSTSAALLQQVWPLLVARSFLHDEQELNWLNKLECIIRVKGFGLATDYAGKEQLGLAKR